MIEIIQTSLNDYLQYVVICTTILLIFIIAGRLECVMWLSKYLNRKIFSDEKLKKLKNGYIKFLKRKFFWWRIKNGYINSKKGNFSGEIEKK